MTRWLVLWLLAQRQQPPPRWASKGQPFGWGTLLLGVTLLAAGCATLAPCPGPSGSAGAGTAPLLADTSPGPPTLHAAPPAVPEADPVQRLYRHRSARGLGAEVSLRSAAVPQPSELPCGGRLLPARWPEYGAKSSSELLEPLLVCLPGEYVAVQERVNMPRLVRELDDWHAVLLGGLGPIREDAAAVLNRKRAAFLVRATEEYGSAYTQVLAVFVFHTSYDEDVGELLRLLAEDKRLWETLHLMPAVKVELEARGFKLSEYQDRSEQAGDVLRGLGRVARDALASSPLSDGARYMDLSAKRAQLPPAYQEAFIAVEEQLARERFSPGTLALGSFDSVTFGVPLGLYYLVEGTGQGVVALGQGKYELATRGLAPAALLVTGYAGGKAVGVVRGLSAAQLRGRLMEVARHLETRVGVEGLVEVARYMRARREAGRFVAVGGADAAVALHEARGDVARAQAWLSQAKPERGGASATKGKASSAPGQVASVADDAASSARRPASLSALVDESAGLTSEVVESKLVQVELESQGSRLGKDVVALEQQRPTPESPPPTGRGHPLWSEYVAYYEKRLAELRQGKTNKGPLRWEAYEEMRGLFARGLAFERFMVELLRADAALPRELRRFLGGFIKPRIEMYVGVWKPKTGLRFADVLVIEESPLAGQPPRVETFSFKSRDLSLLRPKDLKTQMVIDASEALGYYGETVEIRRSSLKPLLPEGIQVPVQKVHLIYEGGGLKPGNPQVQKSVVQEVQSKILGVEVRFP